MIVLITLLLFAIPILCNKVELRSPRVTTFGDWNSWARCRDGEFAYAIQVKVEGKQGSRGDDTGLNAVALYCRPLGSDAISRNNKIMSGEAPWGGWGGIKYCPNNKVLIGFTLRSEQNQRDGDDCAADNFAGYCGTPHGPRNRDSRIQGDGTGWGDWTDDQWCPEGYAVCGIQSQIEKEQGRGDDTAVNNVDLECCQVGVSSCNPGYSLVRIGEYDNRRGAGTVTKEFQQRVSITKTSGVTTTLSNSEKYSVSKAIEAGISATHGMFTAKVNTALTKTSERITTSQLQRMIQDATTHERIEKITFTVPAWHRVIVEQLIITCGGYEVGIAKTISRS
ncbi:Vitelline membrane outer layer protein 1 [Caenorhabditis elegans]|uniref:Vitelline membrane outer layer protein 1 n=1 Tax=Caenorhabditis elegans TaxID=6239 RepID=Q9N2S5_CAEEL|nr:Vitelline membrane outer layer protein 1 [Caenorhabditis elegans]CCD68684.2 Vitelline membrane outer layer protein 1 [Caenorhabditis elegans]|eukprot:NP_500684.2 Uncharacterized protein CELE_Y9C9A.1 [Caenorhabditis elegans]